MSSSGNEASKPRHRASVACTACRERRTRCVVPAGQSSCTQCNEAGQECVIKNDDQRRKPVSKAYVSQLEEHIQQLENALREKEEQSARNQFDSTLPDEHPHPHPLETEQPEHIDLPLESLANPAPPDPIFLKPQPVSERSQHLPADPLHFQQYPVFADSPPRPEPTSTSKPSMAHRLLSTRGHVSFDQLAGQQRYFGPTTNCHIYLDIAASSDESRRQAREQARRTQRVLSALPQDSQDYLLHLFWKHYNSVIRVVDQEAFEIGRDTGGGGPFYSGFLHICILAAGYRFADKQRPDMLRIALPGRESLLHREAKYMLDYEMERPGGLPSIAALLLLGDLEVGCGRDNAGWLYSGMAYRLCFDVGLHLDRRSDSSGLSERDIEIGRMTLWACVIFDRYWALFLGRPTALKPDDLEIYELSQRFDRLGTSPPGSAQDLEMQIYQALFELMEMAGKITAITHPSVSSSSSSAFSSARTDHDRVVYLRMAALDSELEKWYTRLPEALKYTADNAATAPPSFFLLHQQYYSTMIMLHRPFAGYDDILDDRGERKTKDTPGGSGGSSGAPAQVKHLFALSQSTCTTCAGRIAQIFWQQRQRFDTRRIFVTGLQHAGNAATALVAAIASSTDNASNDRSMRYLECLVAVLEDLSEAYHPAEQMATIFKAVQCELRELQVQTTGHPPNPAQVVPARRSSSAESDHALGPSKRGPSINRPQAGTSGTQQMEPHSMSWPGDDSLLQLSAIMPSPAMTYQSTSEKQGTTRRPQGHDAPSSHMAGADSGVGSLDDSWSIFSAPDRFAIGNVMNTQHQHQNQGQGPPSPWPAAETPSFFRFADSMAESQPQVQAQGSSVDHSFMDLVEDSQGPNAGEGLDAVDLSLSRKINAQRADAGFPSTSRARTRGHPPMKRKSPPTGMEGSIWTEILT
ncbi:fungal-specific transcription factor domain-containing protein [Aspergillus germanicus]